MNKAKTTLLAIMVRRVSFIYGTYASTSMLTPDFSSMVMRSSQMVICLIQRRTSDSSNSVR